MFPIIMYHALSSDTGDKKTPINSDLYLVSESDFESQMKYLYDAGFRSLLLKEFELLTKAEVLNGKFIVISFDDGHKSNCTIALPILKKYGFKAEFFITAGDIGMPNFMNTTQVKKMVESGMSVQSHGYTHRFLTDMEFVKVEEELKKSKQVIEGHTEKECFAFSCVGGRYPGFLGDLAKEEGYRIICTSKIGLNNVETNLLQLKRVAIRFNIDSKEFRSIVNGNWFYFFKKKLFYSALDYAKKYIGSSGYEKLRSKILGNCK